MIRLIYISTTRTILSERAIEEIMRTSRRNNRAVGVTGLLVVGGNRFLQALEGPADAVINTYERIKGDARHFAPVILSRRPIHDRDFADWAMGYQPAGPAHGDGSIADDVAALIASIEDPIVHAYFLEFAKRHAA